MGCGDSKGPGLPFTPSLNGRLTGLLWVQSLAHHVGAPWGVPSNVLSISYESLEGEELHQPEAEVCELCEEEREHLSPLALHISVPGCPDTW